MVHNHKIKLFSGRSKPFLCLLFFSVTFFCSGQYFNIYSPVRDSIDTNVYFYHVDGIANFPDSAVLHVELLTNEAPPAALFEGMVLPVSQVTTSLSGFLYDPVTGLFSFSIGNFPTSDLYLHLWLTIGDAIENEIYYKQ